MHRLLLCVCGFAGLLIVACDGSGDPEPEPEPEPEQDCPTWYPDVDGDGLGDDRSPVTTCEEPDGYVTESGDPEPECATDDTDGCGVCGGGDADQDCAGVCLGAALVDACGTCVGGTTGLEAGASVDCAGVCDGEAYIDECSLCVGGTTGVEPSDPEACPLLPDFTADQDYLAATLSVDYVDVGEDSCLVDEGCVHGLGLRKVIRFGTRVGNVGTADHVLGVPPGPGYHWDACHEHYHYADYADYQMLDVLSGLPVNEGHKNGFCLLDSGFYDPDLAEEYGSSCGFYTCSNQGIGVGCHDTYGPALACQWVDITGIEDGTYQVVVTLNPDGNIAELTPANNSATATVELVGDEVTYLGP